MERIARQWVTKFAKWPKSLNPKSISRLEFFLHPPQNLNLYIGRIVLLEKGEAVPEPSAAFIDTVLKPKVRDAFSGIKDSPFVNVCYFFPDGGYDDAAYARWQEKGLPRVKTAYAFLKENDLLDTAYVYGGDELNANAFPLMRKMVTDVRKACPGLPIATTLHDNSYGSTSGLDYDWFIRTSQDYEQFCGARIGDARARGRKAWWYLCDGPYPPFANMYLQSAAIEGRLLMGAMTQRMKPDGFMMYQLAIWNSKRPITSGPYTDWEAATQTDRIGCADWVHCGPDGKPLSTIRFENFRDGIEDLMYAKLLEAKVQEKKGKSDDWMRRAQAALAVPKAVMDTMRNYTDDPKCLYSWRKEMADLIEGNWPETF